MSLPSRSGLAHVRDYGPDRLFCAVKFTSVQVIMLLLKLSDARLLIRSFYKRNICHLAKN